MTYRRYEVPAFQRGIVCDRCDAKAIPHVPGTLSATEEYVAAVRQEGWFVGTDPNHPSAGGSDLCPKCAAKLAEAALHQQSMTVHATDLANPGDLR